ncbi:MAG TPA: DnaJ domain-containing protein [Candidatus Saccharimonadales bacterium]|nr:DnaJ domain-containing protein [Candidatus Saccharimonadales bacterium]
MSSPTGRDFVDYYELLGLHPTAEIADIRRAYILKAKQHHPDAGGSTEDMQQLNSAYKTLISPTGKAAYDMLHSFHTGSTQPGEYRYGNGREVHAVDDMTDEEIDAFMDHLYAEYRNGPPKTKQGVRQWFKKLLNH